jgi:zinc D-Ala-D-Ala carboxypeptidase
MHRKHLNKTYFLIATIVALVVIFLGLYLLIISSAKLSARFHHKFPTAIVTNQQNSSPSLATEPVLTTPLEVEKLNSNFSPQTTIPSPTSYGHFAYLHAYPNQLMTVASYATKEYQRFESLAPEAAKALMKMIYAARDEKVWIIPVSGFRTIEQQKKLFDEQIKRRGSIQEAAKISAPPGYSEHHTGYAVDLADGHFPKQDITLKFEKTDAFGWLNRHAQEFGFELSFYNSNPQGVGYEPWHWRYIGSPEAANIFAQARKQNH